VTRSLATGRELWEADVALGEEEHVARPGAVEWRQVVVVAE
jgi:hypothetical protein